MQVIIWNQNNLDRIKAAYSNAQKIFYIFIIRTVQQTTKKKIIEAQEDMPKS